VEFPATGKSDLLGKRKQSAIIWDGLRHNMAL
jgi:hypothetical protein